jgi:hypothetical protein
LHARLVVTGGYGHSRAYEFVFGCFTRHALANTDPSRPHGEMTADPLMPAAWVIVCEGRKVLLLQSIGEGCRFVNWKTNII